MLEEIKILLGARADNYTDAQINLCIKLATAEVLEYCNRDTLDSALEAVTEQIVIVKLNRLGTEGLSAESFSGVSETYLNDYAEEIMKVLRKKRKIKVL